MEEAIRGIFWERGCVTWLKLASWLPHALGDGHAEVSPQEEAQVREAGRIHTGARFMVTFAWQGHAGSIDLSPTAWKLRLARSWRLWPLQWPTAILAPKQVLRQEVYTVAISKAKAHQARLKESILQLKTTRWGPETATQVAPPSCICASCDVCSSPNTHLPAFIYTLQHHASRLNKVDPHSRAAAPASCPTAARPCGGELPSRCLPSLGLPSPSVQGAPLGDV